MKPVAAGALCHTASSSRPSTTTGEVRSTACTRGVAAFAWGPVCAAAGAASADSAARTARAKEKRRGVCVGSSRAEARIAREEARLFRHGAKTLAPPERFELDEAHRRYVLGI